MGTPLKIKISKIGLRHVLSWPKFQLGLEPRFQEPVTFSGFEKRGQTDMQYSCFTSIDDVTNDILINNDSPSSTAVVPELDVL